MVSGELRRLSARPNDMHHPDDGNTKVNGVWIPTAYIRSMPTSRQSFARITSLPQPLEGLIHVMSSGVGE
jgi:hypothetical protein